MLNEDAFYMREALKQAQLAFEADEIPVGAVVVCNGSVIARGYNQVERLNDPTAHAEMIAITAATNYLTSKILSDCTLYVTLQPCAMCSGALREAQIGRIVYGAADNNKHSARDIPTTGDVMTQDCKVLIDDFFNRLRDR